jgi:LysM repeat protein
MAPTSMATNIAAATPAPASNNGGTEAPAAAAPAPQPAQEAWGGQAQNAMSTNIVPPKPNSDHNWVLNTQDGPHKNQWYYDEMRGSDQTHDGSAGFVHVYENGDRVYVAKTQPDAIGGGAQNNIGANVVATIQTAHDASHDTTTVTDSSSSVGNVNNADGLHNGTTGFSGHASELHGSAPADTNTVPAEVITPTAAPAEPGALQRLPGPGGAPGHSYTVVQGDSMWDIAQKHNMSLEQLTALNPQIEHPELILPGQQITLSDPFADAPSSNEANFPTTSTYDTTTTQPQTAEAHQVSLAGWSDGTGGVPTDPANSGIASVPPVQTDPLKIDDKGHAA